MRYVFGYGSLVNAATHSYRDVRPARLWDWRRLWCQTPVRDLAFLSAEPAAGFSVDGVIAQVPEADWAALDEREAAYDRHDVTDLLEGAVPQGASVVAYSVPRLRPVAPDSPALLSYVDVIVQGFYRLGGAEAVAQFFATTAHWEGGLLDDRTQPLYPRSQPLTAEERALADREIARLGLRIRAGEPPA